MALFASFLATFFLTALLSAPNAFGQKTRRITCKDYAGRDVDWFVLYKLPKTKHTNGYRPLYGGEMAYYDSGNMKKFWLLLPSDIYFQKLNPIKETLAPIFAPTWDKKQVAFAAYNDQLPEKYNGTRGGHSKGILMAGQYGRQGAVWLQHSVPRFVEDLKAGYAYPKSGRENGQLFLCLSLPLISVDIVAQHLQVQAANIYQTNAPDWAKKYHHFWRVLKKNYTRGEKGLKIDILRTTRNKPVLAIAKSPQYLKDVYTEDMGKQMKDSLFVQSWQNGAGGALKMECSTKYSVNDINAIGVTTQEGNVKFSTKEDHSKWSVARHKGIFCFSSLNRMASQMKRGGEITCLYDSALAQIFRKSIAERNRCPNDRWEY